jgi:hypothetical protein
MAKQNGGSINNEQEAPVEIERLSREELEKKEPTNISKGMWANKHKIPGKHKLKYDSIFKGKKDKDEDVDTHRFEGFDVDTSSVSWQTKYDFEEYNRLKDLRQEIYEIIIDKTAINLKANRRKPGRTDFNDYYKLLTENLDMKKYSHSEIFTELSFYFSENVYNMFKLLDQKWGKLIMKELSRKYNIKELNNFDFI